MKPALWIGAILAVITAGTAGMAHEGHQPAKPKASAPAPTRPAAATDVRKVRLSGEIVDPQCWFTHNAQGKDHAKCAVMCARGGQDLALLETRTGALHTLIAAGHGKNPNDALYEHVGVPVSVSGTLYSRGNNRGLLIDRVEAVR